MREQVLSPARQPLHMALAPIDAGSLASDSDAFDHLIDMPPSEWVQRLAAFRIHTKLSVDFAKADPVADEHTWRQAKNGDFGVRHLSKGGGSVEWLRVGDKILVKNQKGEWRAKAVRAEQQDEEPALVLQSARDLFAIFEGAGLSAPDPKAVHDRPAFVYKLTFVKTGKASPSRLLGDDVEPESLSGTIAVDKQTGVLLAADIKGVVWALPMPPPPRPIVLPDGRPPLPPAGKTKVAIHFTHITDSIGDDSLAPDLPHYISEIERKHPHSTPLTFWQATGSAKKYDDSDEEE